MNEFETAMKMSNHVVLSIWPVYEETPLDPRAYPSMETRLAIQAERQRKRQTSEIPQPLALQRIWCLYEIMTCLKLKKDLRCAVTDDALGRIRSDLFQVDVEKAQATVPSDIELILNLVKTSIGIEEMNRKVLQCLQDSLTYQLASLDPSCFDGDGWVYSRRDRKKKPSQMVGNKPILMGIDMIEKVQVKDIHMGDEVLTCLDLDLFHKHRQRQRDRQCSAAAAADDDVMETSVLAIYKENPSLFAWATIALVTKDDIKYQTNLEVCEVQGLRLTADHPIWSAEQGKWMKARDVSTSISVSIPSKRSSNLDYVYNIELAPAASNTCSACDRSDLESVSSPVLYGNVIVNDLLVMTLGHDYTFDPETDKLYGYGWKTNPKRKQYLKQQEKQLSKY
jgi:hypothetical protein